MKLVIISLIFSVLINSTFWFISKEQPPKYLFGREKTMFRIKLFIQFA